MPRKPALAEWIPTSIVIVLAMLLGGAANPINDMIIECTSILLLAYISIRSTKLDWTRSRLGWFMILAFFAVATIELAPIPFYLWRNLPGREGGARILGVIGAGENARSLSLDPNATIDTLIQTIPGLAVFVATLSAGRGSFRIWTLILIGCALISISLGALQITGQSAAYLYDSSDHGMLTGLFANHNHASDMLLVALALLSADLVGNKAGNGAVQLLIAVLMVTLAIGILLTASRFGISLLLGEIVFILIWACRGVARGRLGLVSVAIGAGAIVATVLSFNPAVSHALGRFDDFSGELRGGFWRLTIKAAEIYWPFGSGLGTFVPVYAGVESLNTMPPQVVNHAHNEYLELVCELGVFAILSISIYFISVIYTIFRHLRRATDPVFVAASLGLSILLMHSFVEFPLRNESLLVTFGILNGIVFGAAQTKVLDES